MATYQAIYNFAAHVKGDTWSGAQITIQVNSAPLNIAGASIRATFRHPSCKKEYTLSTTNGDITITNGAGGVFRFDPAVIDWAAGTYVHDIEFTLSDGRVRTYIIGTFPINEDTTD